jgi:hypothetical protein
MWTLKRLWHCGGLNGELLVALKAMMPRGWDKDATMDHMPGVKIARLAIAKAEKEGIA